MSDFRYISIHVKLTTTSEPFYLTLPAESKEVYAFGVWSAVE